MSPQEIKARMEKAIRLEVAFSIHLNVKLTLADKLKIARGVSYELWCDIAEGAGINKPSFKTVEQVIRMLEIQVDQANKNPFEGL